MYIFIYIYICVYMSIYVCESTTVKSVHYILKNNYLLVCIFVSVYLNTFLFLIFDLLTSV